MEKLVLAICKLRYVIGIAIVAIVIVGCGEKNNVSAPPPAASSSVGAKDYHIEYVPYQGKTLTCLVKAVASNYSNARGGISCDWVAFHRGGK